MPGNVSTAYAGPQDPIPQEPGARAYHTYGESACWLTHDGKPMPAWVDLPSGVKAHWAAVEEGLLRNFSVS